MYFIVTHEKENHTAHERHTHEQEFRTREEAERYMANEREAGRRGTKESWRLYKMSNGEPWLERVVRA